MTYMTLTKTCFTVGINNVLTTFDFLVDCPLGACPTLRKSVAYAAVCRSCAISWRHRWQHEMLRLPMSDRLLEYSAPDSLRPG